VAVKPMLDDLELQLVQQIEADEHQVRAQHAVPALEGDFLQALGRRAERITLKGILTVDDDKAEPVGEKLKKLREKFRAAQPVPFAADIATATKIDTVLIEEMSVRELAGKPERFEYAFALREYIPAPPPEEEKPPPPPEPLVTTLIVEVIVDGQPGFDFSKVTVTVEGHKEDGSNHQATLTNRTDNVWTEENFPPGSYTARAVVTGPPAMSGSEQVQVQEGQKAKVTIVLRPGSVGAVALAYVIHYWFDKAFIEPCLRPVLREVAQRAAGNEKLLIVGHTDLVGNDEYNQALSERRARGAFAFLTFGNNPDASVAEWNELRKTRSADPNKLLNDNWGVREYQYMLQDLGFYVGPINEDNDDNTKAAVRAFQTAKGLAVDGKVGDETWPVLIRDYLAQDNLSVDESRFFGTAKDGCDSGPLKWLGCGEKDPVENTQNAWRPNRRTEMLFITADKLPVCDVPKPVTFDIRPDGSTPGDWCLGNGNRNQPLCFLTRKAEKPNKFLVQSAHPEKVQVSGQITFEDGAPFAKKPYALIAPDGEYLHTGKNGQADKDGERPSGPQRGRPNHLRTDDQGRFNHPQPTPVGTYILELPDLLAPQVAREDIDPPFEARGNVVCMEFEPKIRTSSTLSAAPATAPAKGKGGVVQKAPVPAPPVNPSITLVAPFVAVKKPHTNPPRVKLTLQAGANFNGKGTLTRAGNLAAVRLFTAATGGAAIAFDGKDNVFSGASLAAGVNLFAEAGPAPSTAAGDYKLTLTLNPVAPRVAGPPASASLTAVLFTLDIALSRPAPGTVPPVMSEADKVNTGRLAQVRDSGFSHERAMLTIRPPTPLVAATLQVVPDNGRVQLFINEIPAGGQVSIPTPFNILSGIMPPDGIQRFVEGVSLSTAARDTGFRLRVQELNTEVDRVAITTAQIEVTENDTAAAPARTFVRFGLWDRAFRAPGAAAGAIFNEAGEANNFAGADSRRLHIRVRDISARNSQRIQIDWFTLNQAGANLDAPASREITLIETPASSGTFVSRGLLLVTDRDDQRQATHSGMLAGFPDANSVQAFDARNHRLRRGSMTGTMRMEYQRVASTRLQLQLPVFRRTPDERRRLPLQIFVLLVAPGGAGVIPTGPTAAIWGTDLRVIRETYERIGVTVDTVVAPGTAAANIVTNGPDSIVLVDPPAGVAAGGLISPANQSALGTAHPPIPNTIRVFFVAGLTSGNGGEAFPEANFAAVPHHGSAFVIQATGPYAAAHEIGHVLTNKNATVNTGHYNRPAAPAGNRLENDQNLMKRQFLGAERVDGPKRLWDANDADGLNQFANIRGSAFTRTF
jgi:outer membrane protein OmpA-like peptidoglycan-associated protein